MERHAHRHGVLPPQRWHRTVMDRIKTAAREVGDTGHAEPVELAKISFGAFDLVLEGWSRDLVGEEVEGAVVAGDHAGEIAGRILLGLAARNLGLRRDVHRLETGRRPPSVVVEPPDINPT